MTTITVGTSNPSCSSVGGVLFNKNHADLIAYPANLVGVYAIPGTVTNIEESGFYASRLTGVTIPSSVTNITFRAFSGCGGLKGIYFQGNAPDLNGDFFFGAAAGATAYYLAGTTGWGPVYGRLPTVMLNSQGKVVGSLSNVGLSGNQFGFTFNGTNNQVVAVEASTSLTNPNWQPVQTNTLSGTTFNFTDPQSKNYSGRFYRISPKQ